MFNKWHFVFISLSLLFFNVTLSAQSFGFGCLGLVGGYVGYSYQVYNPVGLNTYIQAFNLAKKDSAQGPLQNFGKSSGYRVGINFYRADLRGFILTAKGFYQSLGEESDATFSTSLGTSNTSLNYKLTTWGLGFDLGTSITRALSWKVIDAALLFNSAQLTNTTNSPGAITNIITYKSDKQAIGYTVGTGFIFAVIDQYLTLEGLAGFTFLKIDNVKQDNSASNDSPSAISNFIASGGFNAVLQLNIGFPL
jgi:hypothetical protein